MRIIDRAYLRHCKARERRENVVRVKRILGVLTSLRLTVVKNDTRTLFYSFIYFIFIFPKAAADEGAVALVLISLHIIAEM